MTVFTDDLPAMFGESVRLKSANIQVTVTTPGLQIFGNKSDINYRIIVDKTNLPIEMRKEMSIAPDLFSENGKNPVQARMSTVTVK